MDKDATLAKVAATRVWNILVAQFGAVNTPENFQAFLAKIAGQVAGQQLTGRRGLRSPQHWSLADLLEAAGASRLGSREELVDDATHQLWENLRRYWVSGLLVDNVLVRQAKEKAHHWMRQPGNETGRMYHLVLIGKHYEQHWVNAAWRRAKALNDVPAQELGRLLMALTLDERRRVCEEWNLK
ncbi:MULTISPECIES: hypothetical protein [Herbaspirillum]|uniref:Uncharacterized protein n=2 Tax=Herbaspirillum huttiense TaxID=863372 RepID=A0AAJ2LSB9_9BURK|nr:MULTISPECIES: hypothetical protein [Herbaspirillum]MDR9837004.1 hypothetical protein [Herbaspirillum huttiense]